MKALGLDLGSKRVGVAFSSGVLATPYEVIQRGRDHAADHARVAALVEECGAEIVVVGMPFSLDGSKGPAARLVEAEVEELRAALPVPVELHDERLTTVTAHRLLAEQGLDSRKRRSAGDGAAAAVLLQAWLDGRRAQTGHAEGS